MQLIIDLPSREETLASNRERWEGILRDPELARYPGRIETNAHGQIVMTPPAGGSHSTRQGNMVFELRSRLGGSAQPECPVLTSDGIKAIDVGWYSKQRHALVKGQSVFEIAPEICVEILSPSNTPDQMRNQRSLYFEAGAIECWTCDLEGRMHYYRDNDAETSHTQSQICPSFPEQVID